MQLCNPLRSCRLNDLNHLIHNCLVLQKAGKADKKNTLKVQPPDIPIPPQAFIRQPKIKRTPSRSNLQTFPYHHNHSYDSY